MSRDAALIVQVAGRSRRTGDCAAQEPELASRVRADDRLVALGLAASREEAARLVLAGLVLDGTRRIDKAGEQVAADAPLTVRARGRFVSRGGDKLDAALERFAIDVRGAVCLDAGCSTGGFTDCLLQRGAARVYAVDVGYGQFAWSLRTDPRVVLMERTNVRSVDPAALDPRPTLVVADLSFVSLGEHPAEPASRWPRRPARDVRAARQAAVRGGGRRHRARRRGFATRSARGRWRRWRRRCARCGSR